MTDVKYTVTADRLQAFLRYEIYYDELIPAEFEDCDIEYEPYHVQWDDIKKLLENLQSKNDPVDVFEEKWAILAYSVVMEGFDPALKEEESIFLRATGREQPKNEAEAMYRVYYSLVMSTNEVEEYQPKAHCKDFIDFTRMEHDIPLMEEGRFEEAKPIFWTDEEKAYCLRFLDNNSTLDELSDEEVVLMREAVESLMAKGYPEALETMAYSCYGGDCLYPCDWQKSHDILLNLMDFDTPYYSSGYKAKYANSLGYIYFYGRCSDGVPQYDKAFYYFSIGAAGGCHESIYKLADMFSKGLGTGKNDGLAESLIRSVYDDTRKQFLAGQYDCAFADAAYRMGQQICEGDTADPEDSVLTIHAYRYYLEAQLAIELRMKQGKYYGDETVAERIHSAVERLRPFCEYDDPIQVMQCDSIPELFSDLLEDRRTSLFTVTRADDYIEITGERVTLPQSQEDMDADGEEPENKEKNDAKDKKILAVLPEYGICQLVDKITYRMRDIREFWVDGNADSFKANIINWVWSGENSRYEFYRDDEPVAYISAMYYVYVVDDKSKGSEE